MNYRGLLGSSPILRLGLPALALGLGLAEAAFIFTARQGLVNGSFRVLVWLSLLALLRYAFQDRIAALETRSARKIVSALRNRLLAALRARAVPAYRPDFRRSLTQALEETAPRAGEGFLAHQRFQAAGLQAGILVPCLFLLSWRLAAPSLALAVPAWLAVRWRGRSLGSLERAETEGRSQGRRVLADFGEDVEALFGNGLDPALDGLKRGLEKAQEPEWRWKAAQARYPALLETAFFFALAALIFAGGGWLGEWEGWILFSGLLLLAYRPVREAARNYPIRLRGTRALGDLAELLRAWEALPARALPALRPGNSLALENVEFGYAPGRPVLRNFSAEFSTDIVTGITGPNGAGKTTLLRLLAGAEIPGSGRVLWPENFAARARVAYLPQRVAPGSDWPRWAEILRSGRPALWRELEELLGLGRLLEKAVHPEALSGGERQRMALARALSSEAPFLLLDEPTTALPGDERERVLAGALRVWGRGAVVVSHEPFLGKVCGRLFALNPEPLFAAESEPALP